MNDKINIYDLSENRINQAIENLTKFHKDKIQTFSDSLDVNLEIVLQLIENQKAEISDLKWKNEIYVKSIKSHDRYEIELNDEIIEKNNKIFDLEAEIEKKDKMIDEMAKGIFIEMNDYANPEEVKQYFERKVYKGYELMKLVSEGKLSLKQKVNTLSLNYENCTIDFVLKDNAFNVMDLDFELIEDEIDIDKIEEFNIPDKYTSSIINEDNINILFKTQNEIIKAVKQLNNEMKSIKEQI